MAKKKKSKRGPKRPQGYTKYQILLILCNYPNGIEEPELRDIIKVKLGIFDPKGIKTHLSKLKNEKTFIIKTEQRGKENIWFPDPDTFEEIAKLFLNSIDYLTFYVTPFCKSMITPTLLREIEKLWNITEPYPSKAIVEKAIKEYDLSKELEKLPIDDVTIKFRYGSVPMRPYYNSEWDNFFTEEDILEILRLSPTALKKALEGSQREEIGNSWFEEMLLASMILDSSTYGYPGYQFKPELSIEIHKPGEKESFVKSAGTPSYHENCI